MSVCAPTCVPPPPRVEEPLTSVIRLEGSGQHPDKCSFPCACGHTSGGIHQRSSCVCLIRLSALRKLTILSQHHHDLRVAELSFFDLQCELSHRLLHFWILNKNNGGKLFFQPKADMMDNEAGAELT